MHLKRLGTQAGILVTALLVAVGCASAGTGTARPGGVVHLVLWSGYAPPPIGPGGAEYWSLRSIIASFERLHPKIRISMPYVNSDYALEKASVALQGGEQPDISYQYGTNMPQVARLPGVADLTKTVKQPAWDWNDFPRAERLAVTVDGRVLGIPALVDNLAVVYNKTLFTRHHLPLPRANWTWNELAADAKAITDPAGNTFGLAFPADGSETTVWQFEAM